MCVFDILTHSPVLVIALVPKPLDGGGGVAVRHLQTAHTLCVWGMNGKGRATEVTVTLVTAASLQYIVEQVTNQQ